MHPSPLVLDLASEQQQDGADLATQLGISEPYVAYQLVRAPHKPSSSRITMHDRGLLGAPSRPLPAETPLAYRPDQGQRAQLYVTKVMSGPPALHNLTPHLPAAPPPRLGWKPAPVLGYCRDALRVSNSDAA